MIYLRRANERGHVDFGWLKSHHSFSFGHYYDANHMGFSVLRVINDDVVQPGRGFETHGHRDMEIISYVVSGALKHKDSNGNEYTVPAGDVQVMSAGKGIMHSEFNPSNNEAVNFLQIWIVPDEKGGKPSYAQKTFGKNNHGALNQDEPLELLVSSDGREGSLKIKQNAEISRLTLNANETWRSATKSRKGYLHVISGNVRVSSQSTVESESINLGAGDAIGIYEHDSFSIDAIENAVALWFDLPV